MAAQSIFEDIARLRWPSHKLEGSGPIAVVIGCCYRVVLCDMPMVAKLVQGEKCSPHCNHEARNVWHSIHVLNQLPPSRHFIRKPKWAAMLDD